MFKYLLIIFLLLGIVSIPECFAQGNKIISGKCYISTQHLNENAVSENIKFTLSDKYLRVDNNKFIYYLVDVNDNSIYIINKVRKTITSTKINALFDLDLPPLKILTDTTALKGYLKFTEAQLIRSYQDKTGKYEQWNFKYANNDYSITFSVPEYFPKIVSISSDTRKINLKVSEKKAVKPGVLSAKFLSLPEKYKFLDLIAK
jgi:hypothetical protein